MGVGRISFCDQNYSTIEQTIKKITFVCILTKGNEPSIVPAWKPNYSKPSFDCSLGISKIEEKGFWKGYFCKNSLVPMGCISMLSNF